MLLIKYDIEVVFYYNNSKEPEVDIFVCYDGPLIGSPAWGFEVPILRKLGKYEI